MSILSWPQASVPASIEAQVLALSESEWPSDGEPRIPRHDVRLSPVTMVRLLNDVVVASLSVLTKDIVCAGETYTASGLSAVVTAPSVRGRGYGLELATAAHELIRSSGVDVGIFTCDRGLCDFYSRAGFSVVEGSYLVGGTVEEPLLSSDFAKVLMLSTIRSRAQADRGSFEGARIELYSGVIDRLW